ncbi:hypothetical protein FUAX_21690 [Fulvitalea axinellae]|uniref:Uncharacterized protein n=1 Tax=Fulvitalea axinellae TaxID=1182444 RepID=A0AAU9CRZ7_9BACT|nr:hypothetical protein FUAX_21690 [Fulvitalea axinellae]
MYMDVRKRVTMSHKHKNNLIKNIFEMERNSDK